MAATLDAITGTVDETAVLVLCLHHRRVKIARDKVLLSTFASDSFVSRFVALETLQLPHWEQPFV